MTTAIRLRRSRRLLAARQGSRRDEGNMALALVFIVVMTGITMTIAASTLAGISKTRNSHDFALALEAADQAFTDVLMTANTNPVWFQDHMNAGQAFTGVQNGTINHTGKGTTAEKVNWTWKVTPKGGGQPTWTVDVATVKKSGTKIDRHFTATLRGNQVLQTSHNLQGGTHNRTTDRVRYMTTQSQGYQYGFFGDGTARAGLGNVGVRFTPDNTGRYPDLDGYNGEAGIVASNSGLSLGSSHVEKIKRWNSSNSCTGSACTASGVDNRGVTAKATFSDADLAAHCTTVRAAWRASTGGALVENACYQSLTFDTNYTTKTTTNGGVIYTTGNVTVAAGVNVNGAGRSTRDFNTPASGLRIALNGHYTQASGSHVAAAILAANRLGDGECRITSAPGANTALLGAATCEYLEVAGPVRLRTDGGLKNSNVTYKTQVLDTTRGTYLPGNTMPMIFVVSDYTPRD